MATIAAPTQQAKRRRRIVRWCLAGILVLVAALIVFAWGWPLVLLLAATQARLRFDGIHSEYVRIPYGSVGTVRVHYYVGGSGLPVVLVHGLGGRAEDWASLMPQLVRDHHRVYALDLPGYGRSDWPRDARYSIPELAGAVEAFMNSQQVQRADLGGWSMGGWIALRVALDEPQRIRRLMVFDSAGLRFDLNWDTSIFEPNTPVKLRTLDDLLMPTPPPRVPGFIARAIFRYVDRHGWVVRRNMDSMLTQKDLLDGKLGALKMPVLIVWGKQDHLIPYAVGERMHHDIPQSEIQIFDGCGHLAPGQCAARVGPVVTGFLDETRPMAGRQSEIGRPGY
ncbi:MAG TPA: alpha/beta fold hydrolase [Acidobacteriaceae bacterium]|nr:alpha/beta fold hydrolase [Acidobacteriaceae bacterium]